MLIYNASLATISWDKNYLLHYLLASVAGWSRVDAQIEFHLPARSKHDQIAIHASLLKIKGVGRASVRLDAYCLPRCRWRVYDDVRELFCRKLYHRLCRVVLIHKHALGNSILVRLDEGEDVV